MEYKFNINQKVKVKLTDFGKNILDTYFAEINISPIHYSCRYKADKLGYITFQMWDLMSIFGEHICMGAPICFENNEIIFDIDKEDLE